MTFPVPVQSRRDRFMQTAGLWNQGLATLGQGMAAFGRGIGPETAEEKYRREEAERRTAEEKRRVEQDALRKQLGGLMAEEANIPGMTAAPPIPGTANIPMDAMVKREAPAASPPFTGPVGGGAFNFPTEEAPAPSLLVPPPQGVMQTAAPPVPGMGPDPRLDNWKKQRGLLGQLGQYGEARTMGDRIEGLQVDDPPGLVRSEMAMLRPDMSKDDLRELLKSVKSMAVRGMIANRIDKLRGEEREETKDTTKFGRQKELEDIQQKGATERTRMGEEGADRRTEKTVEGRKDVAATTTDGKPTKAPIQLATFLDDEVNDLEREVSYALATLKELQDIDREPQGTPQEIADARKAWGDAIKARRTFNRAEATARWESLYGGGAPAPKPKVAVPDPAGGTLAKYGVKDPANIDQINAALDAAEAAGDEAGFKAIQAAWAARKK